MNQPDATLIGNDLLHQLGTRYPRVTAAALLVLGGLVAVGLVCAQFDPEAIRTAGWPRLATFVEKGAKVGALALTLRKAWKKGDSTPPAAPKDGGAS